MVPLLPILCDLDIKTAVATSLVVVMLNASNNTYNFHRKQLVDWKTVFHITIASVIFSALSVKLTTIIPSATSRWIVICIFVLIALVSFLGVRMIPAIFQKKTKLNLLFAGSIAGLTAGMAGIGGSTMLMPLLLVCGWTPNEKAAPTGNAINMITSSIAVLAFVVSGQSIDWKMALVILVTSIIVSHFARPLQGRLQANQRRNFITGFLILVIALQVSRALQ